MLLVGSLGVSHVFVLEMVVRPWRYSNSRVLSISPVNLVIFIVVLPVLVDMAAFRSCRICYHCWLVGPLQFWSIRFVSCMMSLYCDGVSSVMRVLVSLFVPYNNL